MKIPTITTPRLIFRAFAEQDAEPLHRTLAGDDVLRYFPNLWDMECYRYQIERSA
jgi:RimJ/RimL family protein N-acetyltransferase